MAMAREEMSVEMVNFAARLSQRARYTLQKEKLDRVEQEYTANGHAAYSEASEDILRMAPGENQRGGTLKTKPLLDADAEKGALAAQLAAKVEAAVHERLAVALLKAKQDSDYEKADAVKKVMDDAARRHAVNTATLKEETKRELSLLKAAHQNELAAALAMAEAAKVAAVAAAICDAAAASSARVCQVVAEAEADKADAMVEELQEILTRVAAGRGKARRLSAAASEAAVADALAQASKGETEVAAGAAEEAVNAIPRRAEGMGVFNTPTDTPTGGDSWEERELDQAEEAADSAREEVAMAELASLRAGSVLRLVDAMRSAEAVQEEAALQARLTAAKHWADDLAKIAAAQGKKCEQIDAEKMATQPQLAEIMAEAESYHTRDVRAAFEVLNAEHEQVLAHLLLKSEDELVAAVDRAKAATSAEFGETMREAGAEQLAAAARREAVAAVQSCASAASSREFVEEKAAEISRRQAAQVAAGVAREATLHEVSQMLEASAQFLWDSARTETRLRTRIGEHLPEGTVPAPSQPSPATPSPADPNSPASPTPPR